MEENPKIDETGKKDEISTKNDKKKEIKEDISISQRTEEIQINNKKLDFESDEESENSSKDENIEKQLKDIEKKDNNKNEQDDIIKTNFEEVEDIDQKIIQTESSYRNNSNPNIKKENTKEEEKKNKTEKKEKKGFFASLFSCNSTNEERNERRKKKKEKSEQESIQDEIKRLKKEQNEIKKQKKQMEIENKKNKETQERLNKKKLTRIEEKPGDDEEEDKKDKEEIKVIEEEKDENKEIEEEKDKDKENINEINEDSNNKINNEKNNSFEKENNEENIIEEKSEQNIEKEKKIEENFEKEEKVEETKEQKKEVENQKEKEDNDILNDLNDIKILKGRKKKRKYTRKSFLEEEGKISEKSNESGEEEDKKLEKKTQMTFNTNMDEDQETKSNVFKTTIYAKHNNSQFMDESIFKDKKSFNRYSDNGTLNLPNPEINDEESSNNIVNFLGISKDNQSKNTFQINNMEDEEDEMEYLNNKINKKIINNKEDVIEIIPEKKEEEDESEDHRENRLTIKQFKPRSSRVQFAQAKNLSHRTSITLRRSKFKSEYSDSISPTLINKTVNAEKIIKALNNKHIKGKIDEKIKKLKNEIPDIKTKYEIYMEEEKKKNEGKNIYEEEYKNDNTDNDNEEQVNDWFEGIFS